MGRVERKVGGGGLCSDSKINMLPKRFGVGLTTCTLFCAYYLLTDPPPPPPLPSPSPNPQV